MIVMLHSSKTMRPPLETFGGSLLELQAPLLLDKTKILDRYLKTVSAERIAKIMHVSPKLAQRTHTLIESWTDKPPYQRYAIDSFLGNVYSGLQVSDWTNEDRLYADKSLRIVSGLYGILRPLDGIFPYRLEMGYALAAGRNDRQDDWRFSNLYKYWSDAIAQTLPNDPLIVNLTSVEYSKAVLPYVRQDSIVAPVFLTKHPETDKPTFIAVHAKIARGAFAAWLVKNRIDERCQLKDFRSLNYRYSKTLSTLEAPTFICQPFGGTGLSIRLKEYL